MVGWVGAHNLWNPKPWRAITNLENSRSRPAKIAEVLRNHGSGLRGFRGSLGPKWLRANGGAGAEMSLLYGAQSSTLTRHSTVITLHNLSDAVSILARC